jgi:virulence-associated protein VagC
MFSKVFQNGNSQAVRIPKEFQFNTDTVEITRQGNTLVLRPIITGDDAGVVFDALCEWQGDVERPTLQFQDREGM